MFFDARSVFAFITGEERHNEAADHHTYAKAWQAGTTLPVVPLPFFTIPHYPQSSKSISFMYSENASDIISSEYPFLIRAALFPFWISIGSSSENASQ